MAVINNRIHGFLKRLYGDSLNPIIPLTNTRYTIGRDPRCSIHLDDVNISRKHCVLNMARGGWVITDCGGVNGTYINSRKLEASTPTLLKDGLIIFLGDPAISNIGFVFLQTLDKSSPTSANSMPSRPILEDTGRVGIKRKSLAKCPEEHQHLKYLRFFASLVKPSESPKTSGLTDPKPGPSSSNDFVSPETERNFSCRIKGSSNRPNPAPSCSGIQRLGVPGNVHVSRSQEPGPSVSISEEALPANLIAGGGGVSDCSISSLDSLKTRIRKKQKRESRNLSHSFCSEGESTKELPLAESDELCLSNKIVTKKEKRDLQVDEVESTSTIPQDSEIEPSESLLPVQNPDQMCSQSKRLKRFNEKSSEETQASENAATITYLKERVLKLQHQLLEANLKLTQVSEDNKNQEKVIQSLETNQGISQEQLMTVLEDELCCNICTEILIKPVTLNCAHTFCKHCISVWKKKKKQCPMCREPIKTEMGILVLDNLITKAVAHLDKAYQTRRTELIQSRIETKAEKKQKMKRRRARRSQIRSQVIPNDFLVTSTAANSVPQTLQMTDFGRIQMVPVSTVNPSTRTNTPYPAGIEILVSDGSDSSVEGSGYYGGFGRCYNCGRRGHWSNGCPGL